MFAWWLLGEVLPKTTSSTLVNPIECRRDRKSTRLNSSHTEIYTLSLHDALPIFHLVPHVGAHVRLVAVGRGIAENDFLDVGKSHRMQTRSEEHTSELQSHRDLHSFPTRRSSDLSSRSTCRRACSPGGCWARYCRKRLPRRW